MGCWCGYLSGARWRLAYGPADATATHCLSISEYRKNVINLFNKYDACVGDVVDTDVIFCKFADLYRLKCVC